MGYDGVHSFPFNFEPIGISFGSKSKGKLSPRSYPIQCDRKWKYSFHSVQTLGQLLVGEGGVFGEVGRFFGRLSCGGLDAEGLLLLQAPRGRAWGGANISNIFKFHIEKYLIIVY